jgi:hypothetical protein
MQRLGVSAQRSHGHACGATPRIKLSRPVPRPSYALLVPVFLSWPRCCTSVLPPRNGCPDEKDGTGRERCGREETHVSTTRAGRRTYVCSVRLLLIRVCTVIANKHHYNRGEVRATSLKLVPGATSIESVNVFRQHHLSAAKAPTFPRPGPVRVQGASPLFD